MTRRQTLGAAFAMGTLLVLGASQRLTSVGSVGDAVPIEGPGDSGGGIVLWNTGPDAPEPEQSGHATDWTSCSAFAPYYLASADFGLPEPGTPARLQGLPLIDGLTDFAAALTEHGFTERDLAVSFGPQTLGADREGHEWVFDAETGIERRYYAGGPFALTLAGEPLVGGAMPWTTVVLDYNAVEDCTDDEVSGRTETVRPIDQSAQSSEPVQAVAAALLADLAENGLRFVFGSLAAQGDATPNPETGRTAQVFALEMGRLEVADGCSCAVGIFETDDTHRWDLRWTGDAVPVEEPIRLKVVATTLETDASPGGSLVVAVADERDPAAELEVTYPTLPGDAVGFLDLEVLPGTSYVVTIRHTGTARHYKLGTSHPELELGQTGLRYQQGEAQTWAIEVAADEVVQLEVSTDADNLSDGAAQATTVTLTVDDVPVDPDAESPTRALTPGASQLFSFTNGPTPRRLVVRTKADGFFRLLKVGGDEHLYALPCPTYDAPPAVLTLTDAGVDASELRIAVGERIEIVNSSSQTHQIQSNPHPVHDECPPINQPGRLGPGERGFTDPFSTAMTCGFHDHLNPFVAAFQGDVIVGDGTGDGSGGGGVGGDPGGGGGGVDPYRVPRR